MWFQKNPNFRIENFACIFCPIVSPSVSFASTLLCTTIGSPLPVSLQVCLTLDLFTIVWLFTGSPSTGFWLVHSCLALGWLPIARLLTDSPLPGLLVHHYSGSWLVHYCLAFDWFPIAQLLTGSLCSFLTGSPLPGLFTGLLGFLLIHHCLAFYWFIFAWLLTRAKLPGSLLVHHCLAFYWLSWLFTGLSGSWLACLTIAWLDWLTISWLFY